MRIIKGGRESWHWFRSNEPGSQWRVEYCIAEGTYTYHGEMIPGVVELFKSKPIEEILQRGSDAIVYDYVTMLWKKQKAAGWRVAKLGVWSDTAKNLTFFMQLRSGWKIHAHSSTQILLSHFQGAWHVYDTHGWEYTDKFNPPSLKWKSVQRYAYRWIEKQNIRGLK